MLPVRQAMEYATDQKSIVDTLYKGIYAPAHAPVDPTTLGFDKSLESIYSFDPDKAKQLLDQAGWKAGSDGMRSKDGQPLEIMFINLAGFGFDDIAQLMQAQFKDIGMKMDITQQSFPAVQDALHRGDHKWRPSSSMPSTRPSPTRSTRPRRLARSTGCTTATRMSTS